MSTTPKKHKVLLTLDGEFYDALKADAERDGIPVATLAASRLRKLWLRAEGRSGEAQRVNRSLKRDVTPNFKKGAK